jgi:hypothetical protein
MKGRGLIKIIFCLVGIGLLVQSCEVAYEYDIESGTDEHKGEASNVTVDTLSAIDVSMYDRARIFPGLVDTLTERRITDTTITLDLSKRYVSELEIGASDPPIPIYSTGLYAGAGELVIVNIDDNTMGLSIQIGSHTDDLTDNGSAPREPVVYTKKALFPGKNYVRNNLGGYIWIKKNENINGSSDFRLRLSNVYRAPDYVANTDMDPLAWVDQIRNTTVPWLELRGEHVAFSVSKARVESKFLEDPNFAVNMENVLNTWDHIMNTYYYAYYGLSKGHPNPQFRMPDFPERVVLDVQLANNVYMRWSGQPIVSLNTNFMMNDLTDLSELLGGNSLTVKALGNNYLMTRSPWWLQMQAAATMIPFYRLTEQAFKEGLTNRINDIFTGQNEGINHLFPLALSYAAADSAKWFRSDPGTNYDAYSLLPIIQLANYDGNDYAFYGYLNAKLKQAPLLSGLNFFFTELCTYFEKDFSPFFDHWGIELKDATRAWGQNYPLLDKTIWRYDPLSENPNEKVITYDTLQYRKRHDRSGWSIRAFDAYYIDNDQSNDNQAVENMLDGSKNTYWHTKWQGGTLPLPHYVVIDMKDKQQRNGFFYANGDRQYRPMRVIVQTTDVENIRIDDINVNWYKIAEVRPNDDMQNYSAADGIKPYEGLSGKYRNERYFEFLQAKNIRYIRLMFPDLSAAYSTDHTIAEFGTF